MKRLIPLVALLSVIFSFSQTKKIDSLTLQLAYQSQDTVKIKTSLHLIDELIKANQPQKAFAYISETEQLSRKLSNSEGIAEVAFYKGFLYTQKDDYINAIDNLNESKTHYLKLHDTLGLAKVCSTIGHIEFKRGNYEKGLDHIIWAVNIFEKNNFKQGLNRAYPNLAQAYTKSQELEKALEFRLKSLKIQEHFKDTLGIKTSSRDVADLFSKRKEHRKAIEYYERVLLLSTSDETDLLKGLVLARIGTEYLQFNAYDKAEEYLTESLIYNRTHNNHEGILIALNGLGLLNLKLKKIIPAETFINEAYQVALKIDNKPELLKSYKSLMELNSIKKNHQSAFQWQTEYFHLKEVLNQISTPLLPYKQSNFQDVFFNNSPAPAPLIKTQIQNKTAQIESLKIISYGLVAAFITSLTILLLIYLKKKSSVKYTQEVEAKNRKIQLQHDAILKQTTNLEEINKVKDRLFSIVSHDLKDSISSIKGFLDLLQDESISKEEFNELIPELSENANSASLLLFNLLNWSKSQMQNLEPNPEMFNIQEIFRTKLHLIEQQVQKKNISIIDRSQREYIYADKSMVEIIIQNLIANAIKFSKSGDSITISNRAHHGKSVICIEDTGVGISQDNLAKLFQNNNFTTLGTKNEKGTGLGLTICKELVELNSGKIWVESTIDVGTKFCIELPKSKIPEKI